MGKHSNRYVICNAMRFTSCLLMRDCCKPGGTRSCLAVEWCARNRESFFPQDGAREHRFSPYRARCGCSQVARSTKLFSLSLEATLTSSSALMGRAFAWEVMTSWNSWSRILKRSRYLLSTHISTCELRHFSFAISNSRIAFIFASTHVKIRWPQKPGVRFALCTKTCLS